jgi:tRNA nucleotidyltransferase (CCA-adding enzyme)
VDYIKHIFTLENIHTIKVGKNITENLCNYRLMEIDEFLNNLDSNLDIEEDSKSDLLNFLDDFLNPGQYIKR